MFFFVGRLVKVLTILVFLISCSVKSWAQEPVRLVVMTDIGGDPDDQQSLIRLLVHSDLFVLEGLLSTSRLEHGQETHPEIIHEQLDAYEKVYPNLLKHTKGFATPDQLRKIVHNGQGDQFKVGEGYDSPASEWLIKVVDKPDPRPVWVTIWGGQRELAQALWKVKSTRSAAALKTFVKKLRVYAVENQDGHERSILKQFPDLFIISAGFINYGYPVTPKVKEYSAYRGMYMTGDESLTSSSWVEKNIKGHQNPLATVYPEDGGGVKGLKEGDTPSFLGLIPNGLNISERPDWGGFGGRFRLLNHSIYTDIVDFQKGEWNERFTVSRWRPYFQNDFAARMQWCVRDFAEANHHPIAMLNHQTGLNVVEQKANPGEIIKLSAQGSTDPDDDKLTYKWWNYWEAGSHPGKLELKGENKIISSFKVPSDALSGSVFHIILEVTDKGTPALTSFRRAVIRVN